MTSKPAQNKEIGLAELLVLATRNWAVLALAALVGAAIGLVVIRMITDKYRVTSLVQIDTQARRPSGSLGDMASMFQTDARSETETELIQSKSVVGEVVDSLGLRNVAVSKSLWRKLRKTTGRMELAALRIPQTGPNSKFWTAVVLDSDNIALRDTNEDVVLKAHIGEWTQAVKGNDTVGIRFDSLFSEKGEVFTIGKPPRAFVAEALLGGLKVAERGRRTGVL
jgi:tyrosine-protein kinase Etk/Wzc